MVAGLEKSLKIEFLGTSSMLPIPRKACPPKPWRRRGDFCLQCRSQDQKDKRLRSSILINNSILIDAVPDIKEQLKRANVKPKNIRTVFLTHRHFDADGGLKWFLSHNKTAAIHHDAKATTVEQVKIWPFLVPHGKGQTYGYLIIQDKNTLAYASDYSQITPQMIRQFKKANTIVLDGSMVEQSGLGHLDIKESVKIVKNVKGVKNKQIYFTHNGHTQIPHRKLEKDIQKLGGLNFKLAYDGLELKI